MTAADLDCLNKEQRQAVEHTGSPLLILAGAGTGKTRVITTKIAYLINRGADPRSILAVTFTKKAASEMRGRAIALDPRSSLATLRTFHSFGAQFLRMYGSSIDIASTLMLHPLAPNFKVYDDDDAVSLIADTQPRFKSDKKSARSMYRCISLAKDYCLGPDDDLTRVAGHWDVKELSTVYRAYQESLARTGNADYGDLIMLPALLLEQNEQLAHRMQSRYSTVMVDEYQDSNAAQFRLLRALVGDVRQSGVYVCVVGDDDQSIYKFRGAVVSNILHFADVFPGTQTIALVRNYRSTQEILTAAGNAVRRNTNRLEKTLVSDRGTGEKPLLVYLNSSDEEAAFCADMIQDSMTAPLPVIANEVKQPMTAPSPHYSDWAVLYRSNAQSRAFETEFMQRKIPYVVVGTLKFYEREEIKDVIAVLSLAANGRDEVSFRRVVNKPARGVGPKAVGIVIGEAHDRGVPLVSAARAIIDTSPSPRGNSPKQSLTKKAASGLKEFCSVIEDIKALLDGKPVSGKPCQNLSEVIYQAAMQSDLAAYHSNDELDENNSGERIASRTKREREDNKGAERWANIQELIASGSHYECSIEGLTSFLDDVALSESRSRNSGEVSDAVTLITVHNTKGLEFRNVILTGMETGVFPHGDEDPEGMEEERRLFYVGVTRARDSLTITTCACRYLYNRVMQMTPSCFIKEAGDVFRVADKRRSKEDCLLGTQSGKGFSGKGFYGAMSGSSFGAVASSHDNTSPFQRSVRVYSDDYGYGYVKDSITKNGETVVVVQFENGAVMRFMPQYQQGVLETVTE